MDWPVGAQDFKAFEKAANSRPAARLKDAFMPYPPQVGSQLPNAPSKASLMLPLMVQADAINKSTQSQPEPIKEARKS